MNTKLIRSQTEEKESRTTYPEVKQYPFHLQSKPNVEVRSQLAVLTKKLFLIGSPKRKIKTLPKSEKNVEHDTSSRKLTFKRKKMSAVAVIGYCQPELL